MPTATAPSVVVISDGLWRRRFGARTDAVGSTMLMDGKPFTIIGVAPADLKIPAGTDYWRPLVFKPRDVSNEARGAQWIGGIARLKPGVTLEQAKSAMALVAERLARDFPRTNKDRVMTAMGLQDRIVRNIRPALLILLGAVTLVMLVACVNVANLLLARASGRTREVSVRAALGAGRGRLVQQFLVESVLLGLAGGVGGLVVAWWATQALIALGPASIPRLADVGLDWRVLAFTIVVAVLTSVVFGLIPALAATGNGVAKIISTAGRGSIGASSTRVRKALVVCEMALAVVLLVGAGLLIRSYQRISVVNPGFSPDHVITFTVALPEQQYKTSEAAGRFMRDLIARVGTHPGVEHAAGVYGLPLDDTFGASSSFTRIGETDSADSPSAGMRIVTPGYFATLKIPLKSGRLFDEHDDENGPEVVAINEEAARRYWPGVNPIGQQLHLGVRLAEARSGMKTIVAVVGDVKSSRLDATAAPEVYVPYAQHPGGFAHDCRPHRRQSSRLRADGARRSRVARSESSTGRHPHHGRGHRALDRGAPLHDAAAGDLRRSRGAACGDRRLRRAGLSRQPAHPGNRCAPRDRRHAGRRRRSVRARGRDADGDRCRLRHRRSLAGHTRSFYPALRRHHHRSDHVRDGRRHVDHRRAAGELRAGATRSAGRSDDGVASGLIISEK